MDIFVLIWFKQLSLLFILAPFTLTFFPSVLQQTGRFCPSVRGGSCRWATTGGWWGWCRRSCTCPSWATKYTRTSSPPPNRRKSSCGRQRLSKRWDKEGVRPLNYPLNFNAIILSGNEDVHFEKNTGFSRLNIRLNLFYSCFFLCSIYECTGFSLGVRKIIMILRKYQ